MRNLIVIIIIAVLPWHALSQENPPRKNIEVSGQVLTSDSLRPVPFANILIRSGDYGAVSDFKGSFRFNASSSDTITISSIGFKKATFIIPDTAQADFFLKRLVLYPDTTQLNEVTIRAWPTLESFKHDFINRSIPDDYYILAMNNLLCSEIRKYAQSIPMDPEMNNKQFLDLYIDKYYYSGQIIPYTIFDPIRWKEFFDAIRSGALSD